MAIWEVRVVFKTGDRQWENVYHIDVGSLDDVPVGIISGLQAYHLPLLLPIYTLSKIVRRPAGTTDAFIEAIVNLAGTRTSATGFALPLFNTIGLFLGGGAGKPGFKYLRGALTSDDIIDENNSINTALLAGVVTSFDALIAAATTAGVNFVYGATEKFITTASAELAVQMRQMHRKRKRSLP